MVISFFGWSSADIPLGIVVVGVVITLASGTISGMRLHRWLYYRSEFGRRLPADTGAWVGLIVSGLLLLNPLQFLHALDQPVPLREQRLHAGIECLLGDEPALPLPGESPSLCP
jgi:hypothetical protein